VAHFCARYVESLEDRIQHLQAQLQSLGPDPSHDRAGNPEAPGGEHTSKPRSDSIRPGILRRRSNEMKPPSNDLASAAPLGHASAVGNPVQQAQDSVNNHYTDPRFIGEGSGIG